MTTLRAVDGKEELGDWSVKTRSVVQYPSPYASRNYTSETNQTGQIARSSRYRTWDYLANWKTERLEDNFVPPDHYFFLRELKRSYGSRTTITRIPGELGRTATTTTTESGLYVSPFPGGAPDVPNLRAIVEAKAIEKAKGEEWNAPVFVAEAHKTVDMVTRRAVWLVDILRDLRRGRIKRVVDNIIDSHPKTLDRIDRHGVIHRYNKAYGKNAPKAAGNAWLELTYGWTPALADVRDSATLLAETLETKRAFSTIRVRAKAGRQYILVDNLDPTPWSPLKKRVHEVDHSVRYTWRLRLGLLDLPAKLGLLNPALIAWELVPFSFVADWFFPVGDYLETLDAGMRFFHLGGCYTQRTEYRLTNVWSYSDATTSVSGSASGSRIELIRSPVTETPAPSYSDFPSKLGLIGGKKAVSAIALLQQNLRFLR
jgi:hypothetical protein